MDITKMIILACIVFLVSVSASAYPSEFYPFEVATGQLMTPDENLGGPWFADDNGITLGTGKDATLTYDDAMDKVYLNDTDVYLEEDTTIGGQLKLTKNATTTAATTFTATTLKNIIPVDAHSATVPITLPDAALVTGIPIMVTTTADPGSYYVSITATGGDKIGGSGGATWLNTTSAAAGITIVSDGTTYGVAGAYGTWA